MLLVAALGRLFPPQSDAWLPFWASLAESRCPSGAPLSFQTVGGSSLVFCCAAFIATLLDAAVAYLFLLPLSLEGESRWKRFCVTPAMLPS